MNYYFTYIGPYLLDAIKGITSTLTLACMSGSDQNEASPLGGYKGGGFAVRAGRFKAQHSGQACSEAITLFVEKEVG